MFVIVWGRYHKGYRSLMSFGPASRSMSTSTKSTYILRTTWQSKLIMIPLCLVTSIPSGAMILVFSRGDQAWDVRIKLVVFVMLGLCLTGLYGLGLALFSKVTIGTDYVEFRGLFRKRRIATHEIRAWVMDGDGVHLFPQEQRAGRLFIPALYDYVEPLLDSLDTIPFLDEDEY